MLVNLSLGVKIFIGLALEILDKIQNPSHLRAKTSFFNVLSSWKCSSCARCHFYVRLLYNWDLSRVWIWILVRSDIKWSNVFWMPNSPNLLSAFQGHLKPQLKLPVFESCFLAHSKTRHEKLKFFNVSGIWMSGIWIVTVYYLSKNVDFFCLAADFDFAVVIALNSYWVDCSNLGVHNIFRPESIS